MPSNDGADAHCILSSGYYQCKATTDHGTAISDVIHLKQAFVVSYPGERVASTLTADVGQGLMVCLKRFHIYISQKRIKLY